jgi:hypothetical protein
MPAQVNVIYETDRRFEVWDWGVGHRGLMLRSNPRDGEPSRIEVWFKPAHAVAMPSLLRGLQISRAVGSPPAECVRIIGRPFEAWEELFVVRSGEGTGWVLAGGVHGREDNHEFHEPTMFGGRPPRPDVRELFSTTPG